MKNLTVKQRDAKILREALAGLYSKVPPMAQRKILTALSEYGARVGEYCECPEVAFIEKEKKFACLDCGKRHDPPPVEEKPHIAIVEKS